MKIRIKFILAAALALAAYLSATPAKADIIVTLQETGHSAIGPTTEASGSPSMGGGTGVTWIAGSTITVNDFTLSGVSSSETQTATLSEVLSSTLTITNNNSVAHTITLTFAATGFTAPLAPPGVLMTDSVGGTTPFTGSGAGNAISFTSQAGAAPAAPALSPDITGHGVAYSQSGSQSISTGLSGTYTVTQTYVITLNAGANLQFTGRTDLQPNGVPEPASVAMALSGLPLLGLMWRRMRRVK
jgi:hypothetical protein